MADKGTSLLRIMLIGLTEIVVIAVSAAIGLLIANWPEFMRYLSARH